MPKNLSKQILDLKKSLKQDDEHLKQSKAEYKVLMEQLKTNLKLSSIEEAKKELNRLDKREQNLVDKIEKIIEDIEDKYEI